MEKTQAQDIAEQLINLTNQHVFLTGKAGTGKTTFLRNLIETTHKQAVIVAPTGIAALNAGGVTIHSFFQLPFGGFIPDFSSEMYVSQNAKLESKSTLLRHFRQSKKRQQLMKSIELIVVDEVSMLRADTLDAMDWVLRNMRKNNEPFGGVQMLFIGDLHQLPPVIKNEEWAQLSKYYQGIHFFNALVLQEQPPVYVELTKIYRQQDDTFIEVLNQLRNNQMNADGLAVINAKVNTQFDAARERGYITLTTHNHKADVINQKALDHLTESKFSFEAEVTGEFPVHIYPVEPELQLKKGAQVMFLKNDLSPEKLYYNGKMAIVVAVNQHEIVVECIEDKKRIEVQKYEWENIKYSTNENTGEVLEETIGTFVHYPIKLAWAITIHKSQGLTFDKAVLDVSDVFASGQAYVALSRLRSLEGLVMLKPMRINGISTDASIVRYGTTAQDSNELADLIPVAIKGEMFRRLMKTYDWLEMASKWASTELSYSAQGKKSLKGENYAWMAAQNHSIQSTLEPARKFRNQLENIFASPAYDPLIILKRVSASVNYFFPILDGVYTSLVKRMLELNRVKKTKVLVEELQELEDQLLETILNIKRTEIIIQHIVLGRKIDKRTCFTEEIVNYKTARIAKVKHSIVHTSELFMATNQDEDEDSLFFKKEKATTKSANKEKKKSTIEQTLDLINEGLDVMQIAQKRQLSKGTVYLHLANLVKDEKIDILQVMDQDMYNYLNRAIGKSNVSLTEMKELAGDNVTFEDLRLYRAHLLL